MIKAGSIILSIWNSLNFIPSLYIVFSILFLGKHPPGLYAILSSNDIDSMSSNMLATVDSIGLFANFTVIGLHILILVAIWTSLVKKQKWAFWSILIASTFYVLGGFAADYVVGTVILSTNITSASFVIIGLTLAGLKIFSSES